MTLPDVEALLRGVPCRRCGVLHYGQYALNPGSGERHDFQPDFPAMAQAVLKAVKKEIEELRVRAENTIDARDVQIGHVMAERDALRAEVERLRAALAGLLAWYDSDEARHSFARLSSLTVTHKHLAVPVTPAFSRWAHAKWADARAALPLLPTGAEE